MRLLALSTILGLLAACETDPATPAGAAGGLTGTIYVDVGTGAQTFKLDLATATFKQLGTGDEPAPAPNGKLLATDGNDMFETDETFAQHRVIGDFDSDVERSNNGYHDFQVDRSGQRVAYVTNDNNLYVASFADGTVTNRIEVPIITDGFERPTWTPDGRVVAAGAFGKGLFISDAAITKMTRFDPNLASPQEAAVSPDGTKVAFVLNKRVNVINIDGTGLEPLVTEDEEDHYPTWSPDGKQIAYRKGGRIIIISAAGGAGVDLFEAGFQAISDKYFIFSGKQFVWR